MHLHININFFICLSFSFFVGVWFVNMSDQLEDEEARLLREQMSALMQQYMGKPVSDTQEEASPKEEGAMKPSGAVEGLMNKYMNFEASKDAPPAPQDLFAKYSSGSSSSGTASAGGTLKDDGEPAAPAPAAPAVPPAFALPTLEKERGADVPKMDDFAPAPTTEVQEKVEPALVVAPVPVSAMGTKMTGLFGGHNLVNEKDLDTIQSNQADITSNMRLLSTMLRGQNAQSERIFKEASHELEELISLIYTMGKDMRVIETKLENIKRVLPEPEAAKTEN